MASEVSSVSIETKLIKQLLHRLSLAVETFPRFFVVRVKLFDVDQQRTEPTFLK